MSSLPETENPSYKAILAALNHLISVVARLRDPESGCPWDLAQTPETLIPYVIEEAYEVVAAIKSGDKTAIAEELGDLLLQVVLQAQIASDEGNFSLEEVARGITVITSYSIHYTKLYDSVYCLLITVYCLLITDLDAI